MFPCIKKVCPSVRLYVPVTVNNYAKPPKITQNCRITLWLHTGGEREKEREREREKERERERERECLRGTDLTL